MPTALVTGASSGIGLELARALARRGYDLVLSARSERRLAEVAAELHAAHGVRTDVVAADLAESEGPGALLAALRERGLEIDVLVNNAGFASWGAFHEVPLWTDHDQLQVNVMAPTVLAKALLPEMVRRGRGGILNVASLASFAPGPRMAVYYATKAYLLHLSEALAEEVRGTGVVVTALCPGPTESGFMDRAGMTGSRLARRGGELTLDAARVAEEGVRALERGRRVHVPGLLQRGWPLLVRLAPRRALARAIGRLNAPEPEAAPPAGHEKRADR